MGIRPADLPAILPLEGELVHRVEPDAEARDFGQKEQAAGRRRRRARVQAPIDEVTVSTAWLPDDTFAGDPPVRDGSPELAHRLDITA